MSPYVIGTVANCLLSLNVLCIAIFSIVLGLGIFVTKLIIA